MEGYMSISGQELLPLIDASSLLDQVLSVLHKDRKIMPASQLLHLQQDAGVQYARSFGHWYADAGPRAQRINNDFKPVTPERFNSVLRECFAVLPEGDLKITFGMLIKKISVDEKNVAKRA
jgi:hypothetical protein